MGDIHTNLVQFINLLDLYLIITDPKSSRYKTFPCMIGSFSKHPRHLILNQITPSKLDFLAPDFHRYWSLRCPLHDDLNPWSLIILPKPRNLKLLNLKSSCHWLAILVQLRINFKESPRFLIECPQTVSSSMVEFETTLSKVVVIET